LKKQRKSKSKKEKRKKDKSGAKGHRRIDVRYERGGKVHHRHREHGLGISEPTEGDPGKGFWQKNPID
jgi:hypothetical protein